jgi:hypothetical protein
MTTPDRNGKAKRGWLRSIFNSDHAVVAGGLGLAAFAGLFPWYVFFHQEEFGVRPMTYSGNGGSGWVGRGISSAPMAISLEDGDGPLSETFDPLATATVPDMPDEMREDAANLPDPLDQPFPDPSPFRLLHVANGRALIEDRAGMYIVRIGSVLPDKSRLAKLEKRGAEWVIVTSEGDVIER